MSDSVPSPGGAAIDDDLHQELRRAHQELGAVRARLEAREASLRSLLGRLEALERAHGQEVDARTARCRDELSARDTALRAALGREAVLAAELERLRATRTFRYVAPLRAAYARARRAARRG